MAGRRGRALPAWLVGSGAIAVAMGLMNLGTYGFTILAARVLGPVQYGALAAVMGVLLVVNVAALGLQATGARRVAATPQHVEAIEAQILTAGYRTAIALGALCLVLSPLLRDLLGLESLLTAVLLAVTVIPLTVTGAQGGVLQGERRWLPLALVYLGSGVGRLGCGAVGLLVRPDSVGAMAGVAVGACLPTLVGWFALRRPRPTRARQPSSPRPPGGLTRELLHNSHALLAFFALSNIDVIVARTVLSEHDAGLYAGGLILTKAVLFLPQFVVVIAFPSMARSKRTPGARRKALALVLAIGALTTGGVATLSGLAVTFIGGQQYAEIEPVIWLFAVLGTILALLQLTVYDVVAQQDQRSVALIWGALVTLIVAAQAVTTVTWLLVTVTVIDGLLLVVLLTRRLLVESRVPVPTTGKPASV
jgi:O-antigen/teichoic acid export membrane protein